MGVLKLRLVCDDVGEVVQDEKRGDEIVRFFEEMRQRPLLLRVHVDQVAKASVGERRNRGLCAGEECRQKDQENKQRELRS